MEAQDELKQQRESITELTSQLQTMDEVKDSEAITTVKQKLDDRQKRILVLEATEKEATDKIAALFPTTTPVDAQALPNPIALEEPHIPLFPRVTAPSSDVFIITSSSHRLPQPPPASTCHYPNLQQSLGQYPYPATATSLTPRLDCVDYQAQHPSTTTHTYPYPLTSPPRANPHYPDPASPTPRYDVFDNQLQFSPGRQSVAPVKSNFKVPRPSKYSSSDNFERFCKRFSEYITLANIQDSNLHLHLLSLVDNETYDKLTRVHLKEWEKARCDLFVPKYLEALYPTSETRTLRVEFSRLSQKIGETVDEFAMRIREMAARAYNNDNVELKEESSLQTFIQGLLDSEIKIKLYEAEVSTVDDAVILARKQIKIRDTVRKSSDDFQVLRLAPGPTQGYAAGPRTAVSSYPGKENIDPDLARSQHLMDFTPENRPRHPTPYQSSYPPVTSKPRPNRPRTEQWKSNSNSIQCYRCHQFGHLQRHCPYSDEQLSHYFNQFQSYHQLNQAQSGPSSNNQSVNFHTSPTSHFSRPLNFNRAVSQPKIQPATMVQQHQTQRPLLQPPNQHGNARMFRPTSRLQRMSIAERSADERRANSW